MSLAGLRRMIARAEVDLIDLQREITRKQLRLSRLEDELEAMKAKAEEWDATGVEPE
ncbi:hypothetical protein [Dactylosporangium sp. CA-139066]|uniref:hypothetical protein n=1 Tax=Dactylosporangium sp. CA-139066 TaxID=3239930 RepID=UPI003D8AB6B2